MKRFLLCLLVIIFIYICFQIIGSRAPISLEPRIIEDMQTITKVEILYSLTKGRGQFADLAMLGEEGLIDSGLASGEKNGYLFRVKVWAMTDRRPMYEVTAKPKNRNEVRTESHSFYSNETLGNVIYEVEEMEPQ